MRRRDTPSVRMSTALQGSSAGGSADCCDGAGDAAAVLALAAATGGFSCFLSSDAAAALTSPDSHFFKRALTGSVLISSSSTTSSRFCSSASRKDRLRLTTSASSTGKCDGAVAVSRVLVFNEYARCEVPICIGRPLFDAARSRPPVSSGGMAIGRGIGRRVGRSVRVRGRAAQVARS